MKKKTAVRNIILVALLFTLVAAGIVAAHLHRPYIPYEEPPDLVAKRLDTVNNAYYPLAEAAALLPPQPPEIGYVKDETGFESKFKPEPGSVSELISVWRPDNDPLLLDYVEKSKPAVDLARAALTKPFFYLPPVNWSVPFEKQAFRNYVWQVQQLSPLLVLDAVSKPCSQKTGEDACRLMQQALDLSFKFMADRHPWCDYAEPFAVKVIRQSCEEHQRQMLRWLDETRAAWAPQRPAIEYAIRSVIQAKYQPDPNYQPHFMRRLRNTFRDQTAFTSGQLFVRRHEDLFREAARLTYHQYDQQIDKFKPLQANPRRQFNLCLHSGPIYANSRFFARVDGLRIAIALELYRRRHNAYPDSLAALAPEYLPKVPKSPYDGRDFEYRRQNDDYELLCRMMHVTNYSPTTRGGKLVFHAPAPTEPAP